MSAPRDAAADAAAAAALVAEAEQRRAAVEERGVLAYLDKPARRARSNTAALASVLLGAQRSNAKLDRLGSRHERPPVSQQGDEKRQRPVPGETAD